MKLTDKFTKDEIEWRVQQSGESNGKAWAMVLPYIQSRAVMDRLDEVFGPEYWQDSYELTSMEINRYDKFSKTSSMVHENNVVCTLSCYSPEIKEWISKQDGAPMTDIESFKGGISDALKRAAVKWGIGRYLYTFKGPFFVELIPGKGGEYTHYDKTTKKKFTWHSPQVDGMYSEESK